jgi:hypothetical protein
MYLNAHDPTHGEVTRATPSAEASRPSSRASSAHLDIDGRRATRAPKAK